MNTEKKLIPRERVCLMNAIAERDKLISEKDRLTGAVLAIAAAGMVWLTLDALKEFVLWASGM